MKTFKNGVIKPLLKKCPDNLILHVGSNNTINEFTGK